MLVIKGQICLEWQRSLFTACLHFIPCVWDFPVLLKLRGDARDLTTGCGTWHQVATCSALFNFKLLWAPLCLETAWSHMGCWGCVLPRGPGHPYSLGKVWTSFWTECHQKAKESWIYVSLGPAGHPGGCCWLCGPGRSGDQRKGGPHPVLSACRDLHPSGRRELSPQGSRVLLSNTPVQAVSSFTLGKVQVPCPWLTFHSAAHTRGCTLGRPSCWEQGALGSSAWSQGFSNSAKPC